MSTHRVRFAPSDLIKWGTAATITMFIILVGVVVGSNVIASAIELWHVTDACI